MAALTALEDVKAWLATGQAAFPPADDAMLTRLITACSASIETWIGRPIGVATWDEIRNGLGGGRMQLAVTPIVSIVSLSINGLAVQAAPPLGSQGVVSVGFGGFPYGYAFSPNELIVRGSNAGFSRGHQNVLVRYTAGYAAVPSDIAQACIEMVVRKYRERTRIAERTRSLGGVETVTYETVMFGMQTIASDIQALLMQYRRVAPGYSATLVAP